MEPPRIPVSALSFGTALWLFVIVGVVAAAALVFLQGHAINRDLADQLARNEKVRASLQQQIKIKRAQVARLVTPAALRRKVDEFQLGLEEVPQGRVVRLYESAPRPGALVRAEVR